MKSFLKERVTLTAFVIVLVGCSQRKEEPKMTESKAPVDSLAAKIRRFARTDVTADTSQLSPGDRRALDKLIEAAKLFDPLFLRQVWSGNHAVLAKLQADTIPDGPEGLRYFIIKKGQLSGLDKDE